MTMTAVVSIHSPDGTAAPVPDVARAMVLGRLPDAPTQMPTQRLVRDAAPVSFLRALFFGPLGPVGT